MNEIRSKLPSVGDGLEHVSWDSSGLFRGWDDVVRLTHAVSVQRLEIDGATRRSVRLGCEHHVVQPRHGRVWRDALDYTECDVALQLPGDLLLPVYRYFRRPPCRHRWDVCVHPDPHGWAGHDR